MAWQTLWCPGVSRSFINTPRPLWLGLAFTPGLIIVVGLVLYPMALALWISLNMDKTGPSLATYVALFSDSSSYTGLLRTIGLSVSATLGSVALSIPLGYLARSSAIMGTLARLLTALPLAVPVLISGYALSLFFAEHGIFNNFLLHVVHLLSDPLQISYTWGGLVIACVWRFFPYTGLLTISALQSIDRSLEDAAASTGASPWQVFWRVTLPVIAPSLLTGSTLTFVSTFGTFSIPLLMGRNAEVLSVMAYRKMARDFDWAGASAIVILMALIQVAILVGARRVAARWTVRG
jgi:putative spermidine/putrescine transport system permease protein